uniref:GH36 n=1 Tax=uncultured Armatimonadetes bacterium TaxID=157466 RepID=A0A6J4HPP9_9BACT|nr:GH36 [uncultured Armatimonadetes bacterium]
MPQTGRLSFGPCHASINEGTFVIGNAHVERRWRIDNGLLYPTSFRDLAAGREWLARPASAPSPSPTSPVPDEARAVHLSGSGGRAGAAEAPSLVAVLTASGATLTLTYRFQIFPEARGVVARLRAERRAGAESGPVEPARKLPPSESAGPTGSEGGTERQPAGEPDGWDLLENLDLSPRHLRLTRVTLRDRTDRHNELVFEDEWLLHPNEGPLALSGNLFVLEDTLTGDGLILVKHAPLPHARSHPPPHDLLVRPRDRGVRFVGHGTGPGDGEGDPFALIAYRGGRWGRIEALQTYQRQLRAYDPARDGRFLSNTWGDRSRDGRINEPFLREEIEAGARLGVDVVQIDDGWQRGRTANSVESGGVWNGFRNVDARFWEPHPDRFPRGLAPLVEAARARGLEIGLWFAPDSTDDFAQWQEDADTLLALHRTLGVRHFKIDAVKLRGRMSEDNLRRFYEAVLTDSGGAVAFDSDVTAETRPAYFGLMHAGQVFVENRYTDWHGYWPHQTLRNLWKLAHHIDPLRLRMEFLNSARNADKYADDPLAPSRYSPAYLFATVMFASPLGWFEVSNLPAAYFEQAAPLVQVWKAHRQALFSGHLFPIGDAPDGTAWTGFVSLAPDRRSGYVLLFRERNDRTHWSAELPLPPDVSYTALVLAGQGSLSLSEGRLAAEIPQAQAFLFARFTTYPPCPLP